jgi:hypothetical protein
MPSQTRLLRDLIHIPESVQKSDFVVSLKRGVQDPERTISQYVVTDDLTHCFDQSLDLVASTLADGRSKGAYLHGSFGSGKSHFMAVLHLLLQGHPQARAIPKLAPVIAKYDDRLAGRRIMLVPYHMVGKDSMEAGVLGGYVDHVRKEHPDAPLPPVFASEKIFDDARMLRKQLGDDGFFAGLGGATEELAGFGDLGGGWDAASFERAVIAPPDDPDRKRLTADLISTYFGAYADLAGGSGAGYVPFDEGLAAISAHAKQLGYDGLLLFLDELILWLASRIADRDFVAREGEKVALLVEGSAPRPVPIVSIIARQRDLKDFIGEGIAGAEVASFAHGLEWWSGRFATITLSDANLPAIVEERLLKPVSDSARAEIDTAFEAFTNRADRALDTLMTDEADKAAFRRSYPFSPALIHVLVGVAAFLQRERTSLRLLYDILRDRRDTLSVGQIVPLGDLWDHISEADEPLDGALRRHFAKARQLWQGKLKPMILEEHGLTEDQVASLPDTHAFHQDARLAKTLLLASLVPDVDAVKGLTVGRLTDLNHGSIRTPIPGGERAKVLQKVTQWSARVGELRVEGDSQDPRVSLQLVGVDIQSILDQASNQDSTGARVRMVRTLLGRALHVDVEQGLLGSSHRHVWRGRRREIDLLFANIRDQAELPDSGFRADADRPKLVIDYPFDTENFGPSDDHARIQQLTERLGPQPTLCWIPRTLTPKAKDDLGRLVILDHLLTGDRLDRYTSHLPVLQRSEARDVLSQMRSSLENQLLDVLWMAYGVTSPDRTLVHPDVELSDQFVAVDPAIDVRPPRAATMQDALESLLDQLWSGIAPAHPEFPEEVRRGELVRVLEMVQEAAARSDRRLDVPPADRRLLTKVVGPLRLGVVGEAHLVLDRYWRDHFHRMHAAERGPRTVERLRAWTDQPVRMLLDDEVLSLVVCAYAIEDDLVITLDGMNLPPAIGKLDKRVELVEVELPAPEGWQAVQQRAPEVFGFQASPVLSASNVAQVAQRLEQLAGEYRDDVGRLRVQLERLWQRFGLRADADRRRTAAAAATLLDGIASASSDLDVVRFLAGAEIPTTSAALGASIKQAGRIASAVQHANLELFANAFAIEGEYASRARTIRDRLVRDAEHDQLAVDLGGTLRAVEDDVTRLFAEITKTPPPPGDPPADPGNRPRVGERKVRLAEVGPLLSELEERGVTEVTIRWTAP